MVSTGPYLKVLPRSLRELPVDLAVVIAVIVATNLTVYAPWIEATMLRILFGLAFVLFVPGYSFVAVLFPGKSPASAASDERTDGRPAIDRIVNSSSPAGITGVERIGLSIGTSVAIIALLGTLLNFSPWGIRLRAVMVSASGVAFLLTVVATVRRWNRPSEERFAVPYREWARTVRTEVLEPDSRADALLSVLLVATSVLALLSTGYAVVTPQQGEQFSAIYLLSEDGEERVADEYPTALAQNDTEEFVVGLDNHEYDSVDYTVVVVEQALHRQNGRVSVDEQRELDRFDVQLRHNESWHVRHAVSPTMTSEDVRFAWLLYVDDVSSEPSVWTADYHVHLNVAVDD